MAVLRSAIIGCGNIGGLCDGPEDERIISHAHAYSVHSNFRLVAACDVNSKSLSKFGQKWGEDIELFGDCEEMLDEIRPEAVSVAVGTAYHAEMLYKVLSHPSPRLIVCEKPLVETMAELDELDCLLRSVPDKTLMINYQRAWDPGFAVVQKAIADDSLGRPLSFYGTFSKGLYHNGCHLLELLDRMFEGIAVVRPLSLERAGDDFAGQFQVTARRCTGQLVSMTSHRYWRTDLDVFCEGGMIRLGDSGHRIEFHRPRDWPLYEGDHLLHLEETLPDTLCKSMYHTLQAGYRIHSTGRENETLKRHLVFSRKLLRILEGLELGKAELTFENDMEVITA